MASHSIAHGRHRRRRHLHRPAGGRRRARRRSSSPRCRPPSTTRRSASWPRSPRPAPIPATVQAIVHGTTTTTNALLERKIAKVGLITTKGFRDVLELGRRTRPQPYGLSGTFEPLIDARAAARGARAHGRRRQGADAARRGGGGRGGARSCWRRAARRVVIHFLHSYINPAHEKRAAEIVRRRCGPTATSRRATPSCRSTASTSAA